MTIAALNYMAGFKCLASACADNCCRYWSIPVDDRFHDRFSQRCLEAQTYHRHFPARFKQGRGFRAVLPLDDDGKCVFLRPDGLCDIHCTYGEHCLPDACALYPRITTRMNDRLECAASFSCPEMGQRALFLNSGLQLDENRVHLPRLKAMVSIDLENPEIYQQLRRCCLEILQARRLAVENRMVLLGELISELGDGLPDQPHRLGLICTAFTRTARAGKWHPPGRPVPELHLATAKALLSLRFGFVLDCPDSHSLLSRSTAGAAGTGRGTVDRYLDTYRRKLAPGLTRLGPVLENFLVNSVFKDRFLLPGQPYRDQFIDLVIRFVLIRFLLVQVAAARELSPGSVTAAVMIFSRSLDHHGAYFQRARQHLQTQSTDTLPLILRI
ncbi:MAG: flagellin lysine-N-methylase [Candidatus Desulforudis sp.]|nr:flagellin lysine-N-methylase [Desulforudis sp.]